jgi:hypothetical protein
VALPVSRGVVELQLGFQSCTDRFGGPFGTELSPNALKSVRAGGFVLSWCVFGDRNGSLMS